VSISLLAADRAPAPEESALRMALGVIEDSEADVNSAAPAT
jgi:hypothetical protein